MKAGLVLFARLIVRPMQREKVRTALTVLAVALGVAVVLAIELAGQAAVGSFRASVESLAGGTELEVVAVGGVPEGVVGRLAALPYPIRVVPRMEDQVTILGTRRTATLLGVDVIAGGSGLAAGVGLEGDGATPAAFDGEGIAAGAWVTEAVGVRPGERLAVVVNARTATLTVRGVIAGDSGGATVVLIDIDEAQRVLGRRGRVDRILVDLPAEASGVGMEGWQARISAAVPAGVQVRARGAATEENRKMLAAFRWNLRVLSYIALVVGAFLIYNTISVSVVRRRPEIGILRALGAGRRAILAGFLLEAAALGAAGALVGLPLGRLMASGAVNLMASTVESLYVSSRPGAIELTAGAVALSVGAGLVVAVLSALSPAREASLVTPHVAMSRGQRESAAAVHRWRDLAIAVVLGIGAALAARAPAVGGKPLFGYLAAILLIAACAMAIPALVHALAARSTGLLRRTLGVEALLASRSLAGSLRRSSVLVGALGTAIAMTVAVGIMVGSFRQTVLSWLDAQLPADIYISPGGASGPDRHPVMPAEVAQRIEGLPFVAAVDRFRGYEISYQGLPATLASTDTRVGLVYRRPEFLSGRRAADVLPGLLDADAAIVSEPFANKHGVASGDTLVLPLAGREVRLRVLDVYFDYASERGYVMVDRGTMLKYLEDAAPSGVAVYLRPGADAARARAAIEEATAGYRVGIASNQQLRRQAVAVFDRTFAITWALEAVAIVVAVVGIAGAMLALVIDRRRELGLLRFLGGTTRQIKKLILVEAGLLGLLANLVGLGLGTLLSLVLVFVINKQSFGWTIRFHWPVALLLSALTVVYAATLVAGLYPARVAARLDPLEVVHEE